MPRWLFITLAVALMVALLAGGIGSLTSHVQPPASPTSAFQSAACPFTPAPGVVEGKDVRCGYLTVPEDHALLHGKIIRLAVAIFTSLDPKPAPDPVLYLGGGPGGPVLATLGPQLTSADIPNLWPADRDLILLDQRGLGESQPNLECTENTTEPQAPSPQRVQDCHDRLVRDGINLSAYNTIQNAEDVHDLIHALGYRQVNLDGVSYGTRLALTVMRLFPADVRSVLLDSTVPLQIGVNTGWPAANLRAFDTLFQGCAANAYCNQRYPHLRAVFTQLVTDLNAHPVSVQATDPNTGKVATGTLTGDEVLDGLTSALYDTSLIPLLPQAIYELANHRYAQLTGLAQAAQANLGTTAIGMQLSVTCTESTLTREAMPTAVQAVEPAFRPYYLAGLQSIYANCQVWSVQPVPPAQHQAVINAIPTLIYAGEYDPTTPPAYGQLAAQTLSRSYFFQFPGTGHAVLGTDACATAMFQAFVEHPTQRPDASCLQNVHEPDFT
jgi:pimeloyl-ACP methyl ester carboxylesterase